jgi:poly-gamma-glutamate capsule biosynthesis protein CapA/YwtB (metallophosphatase superfamily)
LLKGKIDYPFSRVAALLKSADGVFVNLESQLTDQDGETESSRSNLIFCAPPVASTVLKRAGISVVSTANNHAYDYLRRGLRETIENLQREQILLVGTSIDSVGEFSPAIFERNGISIGFLAYTQFLNFPGNWQGRVSVYDSTRARKEIETLRPRVDLVVVSYHGGGEFVERPDRKTRKELRSFIDFGADVVLGHHSHVPQGIEAYSGKLIFHSLGNFVFHQEQKEWARRSFGVAFCFSKESQKTNIASIQLIPIRSHEQPETQLPATEVRELGERLRKLSNIRIEFRHDSLSIPLPLIVKR